MYLQNIGTDLRNYKAPKTQNVTNIIVTAVETSTLTRLNHFRFKLREIKDRRTFSVI